METISTQKLSTCEATDGNYRFSHPPEYFIQYDAMSDPYFIFSQCSLYFFNIFFDIFAWKRNVKQSLFSRLLSRNSFKGFYPTVTTLLFGSCLFLAQHGTLLETIIKWKAVMKGSPTVNRLNQIRELLTISVAVQTANTIFKTEFRSKDKWSLPDFLLGRDN